MINFNMVIAVFKNNKDDIVIHKNTSNKVKNESFNNNDRDRVGKKPG